MTDFLSRARGALMGLAVGDAVGTTNEFKVAGTFKPITDMVGGGPFLLKPGQWTDDTSMALCIADSLLAMGHYDSFDVMERYQRWFSKGYRSSTDRCFDIGGQVRAALFDFEHEQRVPVTAERSNRAGNGAIMRLAPVVIAGFEHREIREIVVTAGLSARETHYSVEAEAGTEVFAALLVGALLGWAPEHIINVGWASTGPAFDEMAARVISTDPAERASWESETSGYIVHGLRLAVHGLLDFPSFKDATLAIANMGGDSDTNAAIYGQLGGAYFGVEAIPASWRSTLYQGEEIDALARALVDLHLEEPLTRFDEDL
ncbi:MULTISPECIES: ADP-ribosylglycohydrolase family protein [Actinomycetaceae]|uniref:ADP-ribosylglycohydrolase family protein n=1 Tax=Actinomycetaceae TaxID=2049 RepID=UPI000396815C|nr:MULTISPECIES: ADP-ribosylglycohydrolase family protein [Actinomycetaceae]ERH32264.1 ADP-ribosylglycohydrolase [Actinomyces sp. oral taxon 172 str. F0311]WLD78175.1 ADP-ribosylglycohydrolase family protein [Schaalia sp. HMT-172]